MLQQQDVFTRSEQKYMLSEQQHQALMLHLKNYMTQDRFGLHTIGNVYFDTENYALIRTSIEKPVYKEKLRLRSYGVPKANSEVFLELKKKFKGIVTKRRISLPLAQAQRYLLLGEKPEVSNGHILNEIDWFLLRYRPVPKIYIAYDRLALFGREDKELRITFDKNIRFRESHLDLSQGNWGTPLLEPGKTLMEIKLQGAMPLWLSQLLTMHAIYPTSFSKYGACYKEHLLAKVFQKGGNICA